MFTGMERLGTFVFGVIIQSFGMFQVVWNSGGKYYKNISSTNSASVPPQTGWIPVMGLSTVCPSPTMKQRG